MRCSMPSRILIADDNPAVRSALRQLLATADHEIIEATDGREAVERAVEMRPDLAIMDLAMPVMDGLTAARYISQQIPTLPIVMCTMHWSPGLEIEAQKFGIRRVLAKGDTKILISTVEEVLSAQPPPDKLPAGPDPAILSSALKSPEETTIPAVEGPPQRS